VIGGYQAKGDRRDQGEGIINALVGSLSPSPTSCTTSIANLIAVS